MNIKKGATVRINIVNLYKEESNYNAGMKPFVFSTKGNSQKGIKWKRDCSNISYYRNGKSMESSNIPTDV